MRIVILGNGATGNLIGGLLAQAGESVTLVCNDELHITAINNQGLWIEGALGRQNAKLQARAQITERPDMCLLNMEVQEIAATLSLYKSLLKDVPVVTLQNNPRAADYAAAVLGKQYILSAAVLFGARVWAGHVLYPAVGSLLVGEPFESTGIAESVVAMLNRVIPTTYVDNIHGAHWTRLITSTHHALAAASGMSAAEAADHPVLSGLSVSIMKEAADITAAKGIQLLSLPDLPPVNKIVSVLHMPSPVSDIIPRMLSRIGRELAAAEDIIVQLQSEGQIAVEYLNGEIVQLGKEVSVPAPYNDAIMLIVQRLTAAKQYLTPDQLLKMVEVEVRAAQPGYQPVFPQQNVVA